jgi:hypothetical protein
MKLDEDTGNVNAATRLEEELSVLKAELETQKAAMFENLAAAAKVGHSCFSRNKLSVNAHNTDFKSNFIKP